MNLSYCSVINLAVLYQSGLSWPWHNSPNGCWGPGRSVPGCGRAERRTCGWPGRQCSREGQHATGGGLSWTAHCGCWPGPPLSDSGASGCAFSFPHCCSTAGGSCWFHGNNVCLMEQDKDNLHKYIQVQIQANFISSKNLLDLCHDLLIYWLIFLITVIYKDWMAQIRPVIREVILW